MNQKSQIKHTAVRNRSTLRVAGKLDKTSRVRPQWADALYVNQAANHMMPRGADETIISEIIKRSDIADNIETVRAAEGLQEPSG